MAEIFLGRHGRYNEYGLSRQGVADAESMASQLRKRVAVPEDLIIISSTSPRALQTSVVIAGSLGTRKLVQSIRVEQAGRLPEVIETMRGFVGELLASRGIDNPRADIAVVTHLPLVDAMIGDASAYGSMYQIPADRVNPCYDYQIARLVYSGTSIRL